MGSSQHCITCTDIIQTFKQHILQEDDSSQNHIQAFLDRFTLEFEYDVIKRDLDFEPLEVTEDSRPLKGIKEEPNGDQNDSNRGKNDLNGFDEDSYVVEENGSISSTPDIPIEAIPVIFNGTNGLVEDKYVIQQDGFVAAIPYNLDDIKPEISDTEERLEDKNEPNSDSEWYPNEKEKAKSEKKPRKPALRDENGRRIRPKQTRGPRLTKRKMPTERNFFCDQCGKGFLRPCHLSIHIKGVHDNARDKVCEHCGRKFLTNNELKKHVANVHMKEKAFSCTECPAVFATKFAMESHVKAVHLKIKPFVCDICGVACAERYQLKKHIRVVHEKAVKKFKCDQCELRSDSMAVIKVHVNSVHLGIKTHQCEFCLMMFAEKFTMKRHIKRIHEQATPFECEFCQLKFKYQTTLKTHVMKEHSEREQEDSTI